MVVRAYTPVSSDDDRGFVDLIIKVNDAHHVQLPHPHKPVKGGRVEKGHVLDMAFQQWHLTVKLSTW